MSEKMMPEQMEMAGRTLDESGMTEGFLLRHLSPFVWEISLSGRKRPLQVFADITQTEDTSIGDFVSVETVPVAPGMKLHVALTGFRVHSLKIC